MRPWQFSKPKNPGFGISREFYLSVLASKSVLPPIIEVANPEGSDGAVVGLGVPLVEDKDKSLLREPLQRGAYAIASKDRKTILKALVVSKEEAGFDPDTFAMSPLAAFASDELIARLRATWTLVQLTFESHDPMVYPALDFLQDVAYRLADTSEGVVADPICQRYVLPQDLRAVDRLDPKIDARDHVVVHERVRADGIHAYTLGLQKFALPEFEIHGLEDGDHGIVQSFLVALSQLVLLGKFANEGDQIGSKRVPFEAHVGGFDLGLWEGIQVLELLPPTTQSASEALLAWQEEIGSETEMA